MQNAAVSLAVTAVIVLGTVAFAIGSLRRFAKTPQEYILGGRNFGAVFLWVLLAGEIYTTFTFLGASGWAYGFGAPSYYILAYGTCGYILGYFLLPRIWQFAHDRGLITQPDFFVARYGSKPLGVAIALLQFFMIVPYVTLQLSGLQTLLSLAGYGSINAVGIAAVSFLLIALFVFIAGLRGTAWASIVKDLLVIGAVAFVGIVIPWQFFGSPAALFTQLLAAHPHHLTLPGSTPDKGNVWYVTTVLLTGIGYFMGPHSFAATYSARDGTSLRRNAMFLPLYQMIMMLVFMAGFSALLIVPGLKGAGADQSFVLVVQRFYPAWILGFIAGTGCLCALVPVTALLLSVASLIAKNVVGDWFGVWQGEAAQLRATRLAVVAVALLSVVMWLFYKQTLAGLLLLYYNGVTQLAPAVFGAFLSRRITAAGAACGIGSGIAVALALVLTNITPWGCNPGFIALLVNIAVLVSVSAVTKPKDDSAVGVIASAQ